MCEWNVKLDRDGKLPEKKIEDNILYSTRHLLWRAQVWKHGDECKWNNRLQGIAMIIARPN
jgi:hypothetical protein